MFLFQNYGVIRARIVQQQIEYKKKRVNNAFTYIKGTFSRER